MPLTERGLRELTARLWAMAIEQGERCHDDELMAIAAELEAWQDEDSTRRRRAAERRPRGWVDN